MQADRFRHLLPTIAVVTIAMLAFLVARSKGRSKPRTKAPQISDPASNVITLGAGVGRMPLVFGVAATTSLAGVMVLGLQLELSHKRIAIARELTGGNPDNAAKIATRYGCSGCHTIPGLPGADGQVAPSLAGLRHRVFIGGVLRNNAGNLVNWIVAPQQISPKSAMPPTGISQSEARDIAAYLYAN
jgi:cytochrome c2